MAIEHVVASKSGVLVAWNSVSLGYTRDGVRIRIEPRWGDIQSDDFGGEGGAPADTQLLGAIATITCEFTKYDAGEVRKLTSFEKAGLAGTLPSLGTLIRQDTEFASLTLTGSIETWTFSTAFPHESHELNKGTKFTTYTLGFEAWINNTTSRELFSVA